VIEVEGLCARAGRFELRELSLRVEEGGWGMVVGPPGAGKTTLLEAIAGVLPIQAGRVRLWGAEVQASPPERRGIAMVYQRAFLFPHLGVRENVAYGAADAATVRAVIDRLGVAPLEGRAIRGLSGGERQLVALARALATRPRVLLLDEPFASLDPRGRSAARAAVRAFRAEWGFTTLHVTHDFSEAGSLGDALVLLERGRVAQRGAPEEVFRRPASPFAAEFLGAENVWAGTVEAIEDDRAEGAVEGPRLLRFRTGALTLHVLGDAEPGARHAVLRAEEVLVAREPMSSSARNMLTGVVRELRSVGPVATIAVDVEGTLVLAALTTSAVRELALAEGAQVWVAFKASAVHLC